MGKPRPIFRLVQVLHSDGKMNQQQISFLNFSSETALSPPRSLFVLSFLLFHSIAMKLFVDVRASGMCVVSAFFVLTDSAVSHEIFAEPNKFLLINVSK